MNFFSLIRKAVFASSYKSAPRHGFATRAARSPRVQRRLNERQLQPPQRPPTSQSDKALPPPESVSSVLKSATSENNSLLAPVYIPEDPDGILKETHPASSILRNSAIVVQRQLEMMNVMLGFEQANRYTIMDPQGNHLGFMAEQEFGMGNMMARQWFRTHRSFTTHVFDKNMKEVLRFHRPFSFISSRIRVYDPLEVAGSSYSSSTALQNTSAGGLSTNISDLPSQISHLPLSDMRIIGETLQYWAPLRRKYDLFLHRPPVLGDSMSTPELAAPTSETALQLSPSSSTPEERMDQFAYVDERFLSWDFSLLSADQKLLGSVNRNFAGFGREIFTDTGVYALRMDAAGLAEEPNHLISKTGQRSASAYGDMKSGMTLDQRAVMLATAVTIDFDYFSRKRSGAFGFMPLWLGGGGEAAGGVAAGEAAGGVAAGEAGAGAVGGVARGVGGTGEGAAVGLGTMAGYEAMQRGAYGGDPPPTDGGYGFGAGQAPPTAGPSAGEAGEFEGEEVWGEESSPSDSGSGGGGGGGGDGDGGGGGGGFDIGDWF